MIILYQVEVMVMEKYPLSPGEKKCRVERETMNSLRQNMRKRLYEQYKQEQNEITTGTANRSDDGTGV